LGNITTQNIEETNNSLKENYTGVLTVNQEQIQTISARAMGRIEKLYFKTTGEYVKKNQAIYKLYSEDILLNRIIFSIRITCLAILAKCKSMSAAKQKLLFYGLSNAQIESIKRKQISPYTTFIVLTADIFRNSGYRRQLCDGRAAISCCLKYSLA
jgi:Cu(I)/Ag(I) efflux system membrane fusion protein